MPRRTDKTGKTGAGQVPAEIYRFPQSGSAEHGAQPANLSPTEQRLYDELLALARRLDKRGVPNVYALVAEVADQITSLKNQGQDTVATLARGLDVLKQIAANSNRKRLETLSLAIVGNEEYFGGTTVSIVLAIGCLISGFYWSAGFFPFSIFFFALAAIFMLPGLWDFMTKR